MGLEEKAFFWDFRAHMYNLAYTVMQLQKLA